MKTRLLISGSVGAALIFSGVVIKKNFSRGSSDKVALGFAEAFAAEAPKDECTTRMQGVFEGEPARGTYQSGILDHLHGQLYRFNKLETADIEMIFCRLAKVMGVNPDLNNLPQTIEKTDPRGATISVTVSAPTESFATAAGYVAKAEIKNDGTTFMTMWWAGSGDSSKGYLIQGANPMNPDGNKRLRYAQWDRTTSTQTMKIMATQFASSFLTATTSDRVHYGRVTYNTDTKAVSGQSVEIGAITPGGSSGGGFRCKRSWFDGTLGGTITGYRPQQGTPEATTGTNTDGTGLDGKSGQTDATSTAETAGTNVNGADLPSGSFDYSCNSVATLGDATKPFASNTVDFTLAPSSVFP